MDKRVKTTRVLFLCIVAFYLSGCSTTANRVVLPSEKPPITSTSKTEPSVSKTTDTCPKKYRVKRGDTLSGIAVTCRVNMKSLAMLNSLTYPYRLRAGEILIIPNLNDLVKSHSINNPKAPKNQWQWPINKKVEYKHIRDAMGSYAIVFYPKIGEPVKSVAAGKVVYAGNAIDNFGEMVVIRHDNNYLTVYAHNKTLNVNKGQQVKKGQIIALSGQSGDVSRPKLYFEVRYLGRKVDARQFLKRPQ